MTNLFRISKTAFAASIVVSALQNPPNTVNAQYFKSVEEAHNPGEERGSFDLVMKPYPIPAETTTYVDFVFNLPEDLPDLFHVTYGEVINSQPEHLHHFALIGCSETIDPDREKSPIDSDVFLANCMTSVGGWAPGADLFGNTDLDTGILLGRGLGVKAIYLNVHYTDGVYVDDALKIATDGIRIHYTPVFRPYSSVAKSLINVVTGPTKLAVPPGESRFFVSRTCTVDTNCKDANQDTIGFLMSVLGMGASDAGEVDHGDTEHTCETFEAFCNLGGEIGSNVQRLCPKTCGLCEPGPDGEDNPFIQDAYRATAVFYHAHLLGREMYTTLIRGEEAVSPAVGSVDESSIVVLPRQAPLVQDLESREFWIFDNQETIPLDFDVVQNETILRGTEIRTGDKIQTSCVFDSTYRTDPTYFFLSTYDEMCANSIRVTFPTPASILNGDDEGAALDIATKLHLMSFSCLDDEGGDVYSGVLAPDEDARDIWKDHPVDQAEGCTFPTNDLFSILTEQTRNCGEDDEPPNLICGEGVELAAEANAGATCKGGSPWWNSNLGITEADCLLEGGSYEPYTCGHANDWLILEATLGPASPDGSHYDFWKSKCCVDEAAADVSENDNSKDDNMKDKEESSSVSSATGPRSAQIGISTISASVFLAAMLWG
jgi:hypothetical protein